MAEEKKYYLTVNTPNGDIEIKLKKPNFDQIRGALLAGEMPSGKFDRLAAGAFFLTVCVFDEDRDTLGRIEKEPKAHAAAALEATEFLSVYKAELKKK